MLPKWFDDWNNARPMDIFGPAILIGAIGGAVVIAAMLASYGQPFATTSIQTGPRGIGMEVVEFASRAPDPTIEGYVSSDPIPPEPGAQTAGEAYPDAEPLLADLSVENYDRLLAAMRSWTGIPDLLEDPDNYQSVVARRMIQMTQYINEEWDAHVNANAEVGVNCYTCHRGQPVPTNIWFRIDPVTRSTAGWSSVQNSATAQSQFTSLPSDALYRYLFEYDIIAVHDLDSRVGDRPSDEGVATWQNAERTFSLMNYMSNSLGVNCVFCHNSRAFYDGGQVTPQWATASLGISMVQDLNNEFLEPLGPEYPPHRLGPVYADAPKAACATCHKGWNKPLMGLNMTEDWPELVSEEPPVYE
ncbi:MAG: photosynthetic reaction center cytochrome PufC [Pseudomonadota bacterium]